jgi:hypothetical protein
MPLEWGLIGKPFFHSKCFDSREVSQQSALGEYQDNVLDAEDYRFDQVVFYTSALVCVSPRPHLGRVTSG